MNPLSWINRISDYKASISFSPNFGFLRCAEIIDDNKDYGWDLSGLKLIVNGAEPIHDQCCKIFINKLSKYGIENDIIVPAYGMSETTLIISTGKRGMNYSKYNINRSKLSVGDHVDLSDNCKDDYTTFVECGVAADDVNIRITDEQHNDLGTGIVGNIEVISTSLMKEYYNDPEKTKQTFCEDGWLITGDIGAILDGKLVILGRKKEIMFLNGKNYYPSDFESCIYKNLSLPQGSIAVISAFDEKIQSEKVVLFLNSAFLGSGVDAKIRNLIADNINAYSHQDYQFDWLLKKIDYKKAVNKNPIFDLMFNMQNMNLPEMVLNGLDISYLELEDEYTRFDLIMILNELLSALKLEFIYCNKLFESETIHTLKDRYLKILDIILDDPDIKVKDISVLDDSDNLLQNDNVNDFSFDF